MSQDNKSKIIERIEKQVGIPNLTKVLSEEIKPTDLQSLLLDVFKNKARQRKPRDILTDHSSSNYMVPSKIEPQLLLEWDQKAFSHLPNDFVALELSPVAPFGSVSSLAPISQDWVLTTIRNMELISDPSIVLAIECALRRQNQIKNKKNGKIVNLASSHRVVRSQRYEKADLVQHFRIFTLCSAGRDKGNLGFELDTIRRHVQFYLEAIKVFVGKEISLQIAIWNISSDSKNNQILIDFVKNLKKLLPEIEVRLENRINEEKEYYQNIRFKIYCKLEEKSEIELVDGGITDWTQKLLNNAKERLIISGLGSERLCEIYKQIQR